MLKLVVDHSGRERRVAGLYLITDQGDRLLPRVREALSSGGVAILQYRDKLRSYDERLELGHDLKRLCAEFQVKFIVNDDLKLALELDADGVHLGQEDGDFAAAREALGSKKLIGISTHSIEEALAAQEAGADYIGFGSLYPTETKDVEYIQGPEALVLVREKVKLPIVAIGGINRDNACAVIDAGADSIAVISSVLSARSPGLAATELSLLFNRRMLHPRGAVLTIAGSDSGGGAGIQADLKTVTLLGSYGASAITALTAQNTRGVTGIHPSPPAFLADQIDAVLSDIPIDVVKIGMLCSPENAEIVADKLTAYEMRMVVLDPVMTAKGGVSLIEDEALSVLKKRLVPLSYLVTPNIPEAEALTGLTITDTAGMELAARALHLMGAKHVLIKGGHLTEGVVTDILFDGHNFNRYSAPRVLTRNTHGTGCTLASAIATYLAQGEPLPGAVLRAKLFVTRAIKYAQQLGRGHGPVNHFLAARDQVE
ncbi:bifunctional hydroxymethylpyrimidine kinase/phosphomethylpyrimidine kinase [Geomonas terrae]|uniref:Thiamine-phosphate synthase n=1 Tax=Geomonas terrae TaxID=2562681 RepID=A0A4S1CMX3_9BACT|nr:bifunctional hydroxymethylpyrimidine kinase/phosphomethylpyrimidine kinase [Geomonas terrae]TGU75171.1 bifunctional hydroxymethylpyrimidine kinase/phosphomethylpyrimidine kinase [Geomonas terrae]